MESEVRNRKVKAKSQQKKEKLSEECVPSSSYQHSSDDERVERLSSEEPTFAENSYENTQTTQLNKINENKKSTNTPPADTLFTSSDEDNTTTKFTISIQIDCMAIVLFLIALATRIYRLSQPNNVV